MSLIGFILGSHWKSCKSFNSRHQKRALEGSQSGRPAARITFRSRSGPRFIQVYFVLGHLSGSGTSTPVLQGFGGTNLSAVLCRTKEKRRRLALAGFGWQRRDRHVEKSTGLAGPVAEEPIHDDGLMINVLSQAHAVRCSDDLFILLFFHFDAFSRPDRPTVPGDREGLTSGKQPSFSYAPKLRV